MTDMTELERLAREMDATEDAVIAASGQHREDLWHAHHEAMRAFHDAADPSTVLKLLEVCKAGQALIAAYDTLKNTPVGQFTGEEAPACDATEDALRSALAALGEEAK
jgi:putative NADH-flavin reductase